MNFSAGSVSDGQLSTRISHGRTRERTEEDALATDEHGKTRNKTKAETRKRSRRKDIFATEKHGNKTLHSI